MEFEDKFRKLLLFYVLSRTTILDMLYTDMLYIVFSPN